MQELVTASNMAWSLCSLLTQGSIEMLMHHGSEEQQERYLRPLVSGQWAGTMNLTEPEAGSDVGPVRSRAVPADDGTDSWRISAQKSFITYAEQHMTQYSVHVLLAPNPD